MDLSQYLKNERGRAAALAADVEVHPVMVSQWASGVKPVPIPRAVRIEAATNGAVMRWDLRPDDWWQIWPDLVGRKGAPKVRKPKVAA